MLPEPTPAMHRDSPSRRGFRTADAMILVAAVATSLAVSGWIDGETRRLVSWRRFPAAVERARKAVLKSPGAVSTASSASGEVLIRLVMLCEPFLATAAAALIAIRLLPPRPRRRRLALQPGTVAACATMFAMACVGMIYGAVRLSTNKDGYATVVDLVSALMGLPVLVGVSIVSAWTTLFMAGLWRPEPSWIDRLGRIIACFWVAMGLFNAYRYLLLGYSITASGSLVLY